MVLTFREMLRRVEARLSNTSTSNANANDLEPKIKDWLNERYERVYDTFPWRASLEDTTLQLIASTQDYALVRDIQKIWSVYDQTNGLTVRESEVQTHDRRFSMDIDQTGNVVRSDPRRYFGIGEFTVKAEIGDAAETIDVVSTSAADVTNQVVHITGLVSGVELSEDIILTGASTAVSSNTYDANQKLRINVGTTDATRKTIAGVVTVSGTDSSTVFANISPAEFAPIYKWIRVSPNPKSSGTQPVWRIWYSKRLQFLNNDNDIPIIDIANALVQGALSDGLREDGFENEANTADQKFVALVNEKQIADTGPNLIEQFTPRDVGTITTLDYGRTISGFD